MKKYLTVSEIEQGEVNTPIWAINGSAQSEVGMAGEVHVGIPKLSGAKIDPMTLPQTWLAQCLTDQIPRAQLLASSEFRNAVNSGLVVLVTPAYAETINTQEGAAEEQEALTQRKRQIKEATAARSITQSGTEILNSAEIIDGKTQEEKAAELSDAFLTFAVSLTTKADIEIINALRSRAKMTRREVKHLITALVDKPKTVQFLKEKLAS